MLVMKMGDGDGGGEDGACLEEGMTKTLTPGTILSSPW
jgi:hypothetical protein